MREAAEMTSDGFNGQSEQHRGNRSGDDGEQHSRPSWPPVPQKKDHCRRTGADGKRGWAKRRQRLTKHRKLRKKRPWLATES